MTIILGLAVGLVALYAGGELLVRGASRLALDLGITPLAVGLTVVAFGTSAPELAVSLEAARAGSSDIALGNVVGSNICNIGLILGIAALIRPIEVQARVVRHDIPVMLLCSFLLLLVVRDGEVGRVEAVVLVLGIVVYTVTNLLRARRETRIAATSIEHETLAARGGRVRPALFVLAGLGVLVLGGRVFVDAAVALASWAGLSTAVIGLTVVAVGTSLPELAASAVAAWRGEGDIAVGNIVGSNVFNILAIVGITSLVTPVAAGQVGGWDLAAMLGFALLLAPLARTGFRVSRAEGAGLVIAYLVYVVWRINQL